jgi:hypothetical protein
MAATIARAAMTAIILNKCLLIIGLPPFLSIFDPVGVFTTINGKAFPA